MTRGGVAGIDDRYPQRSCAGREQPGGASSALVVYASRHGHTAAIARRIAATLQAAGAETTVADVASAPSADGFDVIVVGGSVHMERHDHELLHWIARERTSLRAARTGFFSSSLAAATDPGAAREYLDAFLEDADWTPSRTAVFAGALQYRRYGFATRQMIRQIAHSKGLSTDIKQDVVEYTDWAAVERFARGVLSGSFVNA